MAEQKLTDTGGPFSEAKLIDVFAAHAIQRADIDINTPDLGAKQAYEIAEQLVVEKRRREA